MEWYYATSDRAQVGPVPEEQMRRLLATGGIQPQQLVWREGMAQWTMAWSVPEFSDLVGTQAMPMAVAYVAGPDPVERGRRNTRRNCLAMFAIALALVAPVMLGLSLRGQGRVRIWAPNSALALDWMMFTGLVGLVCGVFALVYVPVQFKAIRQQPGPVQWMGLAGGLLLVVMLPLSLFLLGVL